MIKHPERQTEVTPVLVSAAAPEPVSGSRLLIDQYLPRYNLAVVHAQVFRAPPASCYRAARGVDLLRDPIIRMLLDLRTVPQRLGDRLACHRNGAAVAASPRTFRLEDMVRPPINWTLLDEEPGVEMVLGQIGRPWQPADMGSGLDVPPAGFASFDQPGFAKIALSLRVQPYGATGSLLTMETRVAVTDPVSLRRFRRYWAFIGPFSHLVRWMALRMVATDLRREMQDALPERFPHRPRGRGFEERSPPVQRGSVAPKSDRPLPGAQGGQATAGTARDGAAPRRP
jgi:hypothetical protein